MRHQIGIAFHDCSHLVDNLLEFCLIEQSTAKLVGQQLFNQRAPGVVVRLTMLAEGSGKAGRRLRSLCGDNTRPFCFGSGRSFGALGQSLTQLDRKYLGTGYGIHRQCL